MTDGHKNLQVAADEHPKANVSALVDAAKTTFRLLPRQLNDEIALAKLELEHKKARVGGIAVFAAVALVFMALLVIALVVAAIAGLATIMPLWLSALLVSAALLVILGISALIAYKKFQKLLPLLPEHAWRGVRHDLGIIKEGRDFNPESLDPKPQTREEKQAAKAEAEEAKAKAAAERAAKEAEHGPKASETELVERTKTRREHLLSLREELLREADLKKQTTYLVDSAKQKARDTVNQRAGGAFETVQERWKPLSVFVVSASVAVVLLRKLMTK